MTMLISTAEITLSLAEKILFKLCKHYAIKVPVIFDTEKAAISFPYGNCHVTRTGEVLSMRCEADSIEKLAMVQCVMDEHLALMARDSELAIDWQRL